MELFHANRQWSTRPRDQRFPNVKALYDACYAYSVDAREKSGIDVNTLRTEAVDGDVRLVGKGNAPAKLTHWAFGQLAGLVGAPASYLRELPATLAAQNLNHGLKERYSNLAEASTVSLLAHRNGDTIIRAITSDRYSRIWNYEVADRLLDLCNTQGWTHAVPDIRSTGNDDAPLYASDHDMFAFLMHSDRVIAEPGNPAGLKRGLIVANSEVGAASLKMMRFLYREMCGNHIIWGAENVIEVSVRHVGNIRDKFSTWSAEIRRYLNSSATGEEAKVAAAMSRRIAATKDEVLDALFGRKSIGLSRKVLAAGFDAVVPEQDGDPLTPWGIVQGLTRHSQTVPYADERTEIDRKAARILDAF